MNLVDSVVALNCAFFVNAAILILAAAVFHHSGHQDVAHLEEAHRLLAPLLGTSLASVVFAVALLCSGQASTITGTLAGQIVMEGFLRIRIQPWLRRLISRGLAIIPAVVFIVLRGADAVDDLLVLSQVVLSLQLSFAVIPLIVFTSDREKMGAFANRPWVIALAVLTTVIIVGLNVNLVAQEVSRWSASAGANAWVLKLVVGPLVIGLGLLLAYVIVEPLGRRLRPRWFGHALQPAPVVVAVGSRRGATAEPAAPAPLAPTLPLAGGPYRRVAVALEMAAADDAVLQHVRTYLVAPDVQLVLLHVVESAAGRYLGAETSDLESRGDLAALEALAQDLRSHGAVAETYLGYGDVKSELARLVKETEVDLLITGSHGHGLIQDLVFGATTSGLRHRVSCPVLTIPPGGGPPSASPAGPVGPRASW